MKILHTADWHLGKKLGTFDRLDEQVQVLDEIVQLADAHKVDAIVIAGDVYDGYSPPNGAEELFYQTVARLADGGRRAVIAIAGNHDSPDQLTAANPVLKQLSIYLVGSPLQQVQVPATSKAAVQVLKADQGFIELQLPNQKAPLRIIATPYASDARLNKHFGTSNAAQHQQVLSDVLKAHWHELANKYCDNKGVNLLVAHQFVLAKGGEQYTEDAESERSVVHVGGAGQIYTDIIPKQVQYVALGHLHRHITVQTSPMPVVYSSSPLMYSMSESKQKKVILIEAEPDQPVKLIPIELKSGRELLRYTANGVEDALDWLGKNQHALVEIAIKTGMSLLAEDVQRIRNAHPGIIGQPIPILEGNLDDQDQDRIKTALEENGLEIRPLFKAFFETQNGGVSPNQAILDLFEEVLAQE